MTQNPRLSPPIQLSSESSDCRESLRVHEGSVNEVNTFGPRDHSLLWLIQVNLTTHTLMPSLQASASPHGAHTTGFAYGIHCGFRGACVWELHQERVNCHMKG